jgi:O-methyltransferase
MARDYHRVNAGDAVRLALPYTLVGEARLKATANAVRQIDRDGIPGDFVECGVWKGGNVILARILSPLRHCWLYDTFTGMTKPESGDGPKATSRWNLHINEKQPWCRAELSELLEAMNATETFDEKLCHIIEGDVTHTLTRQANLPQEIALLRLDTDWYASTIIELKVLYPRLAVGGVLIVDDYGHWQGSRKAVDEYFADKRETWETVERIDYAAIMLTKVA